MPPVLTFEQVTGGYSLNKPVIHELSFEVKRGEMVGLIGLNGAGKSTTMKHILGLLKPHDGQIYVHGQRLSDDAEAYRSSLVYVPETPLLYEQLTVREHLKLTALAYGLDETVYNERIISLADQFQMKRQMDQFSHQLSKGMMQKLMIMSALLVQPDLYIIDEPFVGLDPLGIRALLEQMNQMKAEGASLLLSSHILATIEHYCDRFIVLHHGQLRAAGTLSELRQAAGSDEHVPLEQIFYTLVDGVSH